MYGPMIEPASITPARVTDAEREQLRRASCRHAARASADARPELEARRLLCQAPALLDGSPAQICGAAERFAHVHANGGRDVMYAWGAVVRILERGGRFSS